MAGQVLTTTGIWMDGYDLSGQSRGVSLTRGVDLKDATTFGSTTRSSFPTLKRSSLNVQGLWSAGGSSVDGAPEKPLYSNIQSEGTIFSVAPVATEGTPAYTFQAAQSSYEFGGQIGEIMPFSVAAECSTAPGLVRGQLIFKQSALTSSSTGTKYQVGAVAAGQKMYAALHITSVSGTSPTLDVVVESDANSSAGGETSRITFSQASAVGSQWSSVAGAVTDTWWRVSYTIGGSDTPTFAFVVVIGVL